ncbi:MAG: hypothetical protein Q9181_005338 [Wetmoreana brouardii]
MKPQWLPSRKRWERSHPSPTADGALWHSNKDLLRDHVSNLKPSDSDATADSNVGFNIRTALKDTVLPTGGGPVGTNRIGVLKGTHIVMLYMGTHRRHDLVGPTADHFDPLRWQTWTPKIWEFFPFNHGPRICLGCNFAWMQMEYVICRVFQEFAEVELLSGIGGESMLGGKEDMKIKIALNTKPAEPVLLRFSREN